MSIDNKTTNDSGDEPKVVKKKTFDLKLPKIDFVKLRKKINRDAALAGSLAAVLVFVGLFALLTNNKIDEKATETVAETIEEIETAPAMGAIVTYQEGIAEYKTELEWETAPKELTILPGMGLRTTGAASRIVVTLDDGSAIRLDANTEVTFQTLTTARVVIVQENGHVYSRVTTSSSRTYVVHTENAQFQSLGTAFRTNAGGDEESVDVFQSKVQETSTTLEGSEGEKLIIKKPSDPTKDGTVERLSIEELKEDSFITWNIEQDKKDEKYKDSLGFLSDTEGPEVKITNPVASSTIDVDSSATEGTVEIEGTTEKWTKLTVRSKSVAGSATVDVAVSSDGTFKTPVLKGIIGNSIFEFVATDRTGNKTELNVSYLFKKKNQVQEQSITLTLDSTSDPDRLVFNWSLAGMTTPDGVKIVKSEAEDPTYPGDGLDYIKEGTTWSVKKSALGLESEKTYNFKVCRYSDSGSSCDVYSNKVSFTAE